MQKDSQKAYVDPYDLAVVYAGMPKKDEAFQRLNKAYEERSLHVTWLKTDPVLDGLRSDPKFSLLPQRVGPFSIDPRSTFLSEAGALR